jgi:hypothetical protein
MLSALDVVGGPAVIGTDVATETDLARLVRRGLPVGTDEGTRAVETRLGRIVHGIAA